MFPVFNYSGYNVQLIKLFIHSLSNFLIVCFFIYTFICICENCNSFHIFFTNEIQNIFHD